ncbi:MAG: hypothetical protein A4E36_00171 [Methanoregulaceae archaeon PtaB.Bin009]|nr:MAG: hypothetical protein A4E36_00171 [Methanoregulaceae archaeon PtaB.Bin009]
MILPIENDIRGFYPDCTSILILTGRYSANILIKKVYSGFFNYKHRIFSIQHCAVDVICFTADASYHTEKDD